MQNPIQYQPIAVFKSDARYPYEVPRQGCLSERDGEVVFEKGLNLEQMLTEIDGFSHLWLIFHFDQADSWKPLVLPPRSDKGKKVGVLASRAPHRPNPIGLSCVELCRVGHDRLHVRGTDLLDGTPILDIKPYLAYCDAVPDARPGWTARQSLPDYTVVFTERSREQGEWIHARTGLNLLEVARLQLEYEPLDDSRKRVSHEGEGYCLACRTWRLDFSLNPEKKEILLVAIRSGYRAEECAEGTDDPYEDKEHHRLFQKTFGCG
jgi:tRNA-Thr(GGU) m(6)t(6)A37 methyltransferase TsaA